VDLTASQRAALVAQLEGLEAQVEDSGQAQAARAARGAALAVQGGTKLTSSLATFRAGFDVSASAPAPSSSADGFPRRSSAWHSPAPPRAR